MPHPSTAANRTASESWIVDVLHSSSLHIDCLPPTSRDRVATGYVGPLTPLRLSKDVVPDAPRGGPLKIMDLDGEAPLTRVLRGQAAMMFRFDPPAPAGRAPEYCWTTHSDGISELRIEGGEIFKRRQWDLPGDFHVHTWYGSYHYQVHQRPANDPNWKLVFFEPLSVTYGPWVWNWPGLRLREAPGDWVIRSNSTTIFLARASEFNSRAIPIDAFEAARMRCFNLTDLEKKNLSAACIERLFHAEGTPAPPVDSLYVHAYLLQKGLAPPPRCDTVTYQTTEPLVLEIPKPSVRAFPGRYTRKGVAPGQGLNNECRAVSGRVEQLRNDRTHFPPWLWDYLEEFVKLLDLKGTGVPHSLETVDELQDRPPQRSSLRRDLPWISWTRSKVSSFLKRETYSDLKDPRIISPFDTAHRVGLSAFSLAFSDHVKRQPWYAFGHKPAEVASRVHAIARTCAGLVEADASRFDGRLSLFHTAVVYATMLEWCAPVHRNELRQLLDEEWDNWTPCSARTKRGVVYTTGTSRTSGSPITSVGNTLVNAFEKFAAWRAHGAQPAEAFARLGLYGGDDSLDRGDLPLESLNEITKHTGTVLKIKTRADGDPCTFLGRVYLNPAHSTLHTIDIKRQLDKLHTTVDMVAPWPVVFARKATALNATDKQTPFLGIWAAKVLELNGNTDGNLIDCSYHYQLHSQPESWEQEAIDWTEACLANDLDPVAVVRWETRLKAATTLDEMFFMLDEAIPSEADSRCVIDGQIVGEHVPLHPAVESQFKDPGTLIPHWLFKEPVSRPAPLPIFARPVRKDKRRPESDVGVIMQQTFGHAGRPPDRAGETKNVQPPPRPKSKPKQSQARRKEVGGSAK